MSLTQITYASITKDLGTVLNTGATPNVSLFSDINGATLFTDSDGKTFSDKVVASINYTEPHNDVDGNQIKNGFLTLTFSDGNIVTITDTVDVVYYTIVAVPFQARRF